MLLVPVEDRASKQRRAADRVLLRCDNKGCTLCQADHERRFPDVQTALDCARQSREMEAATIEIWQGGEYICCVAPRSWERSEADFPSISAPRLVSDAGLAAAERYTNRMAQILMATAGPLFWLALLVVMIAASLGWQLLHP
jgi:hypothetical protein